MSNTIERKPRVWAVTTQAMAKLGRGAARLANQSANQLARPGVARCIGRLRALLALERACKLRQGDMLVELIDRHGLRAIDIARVTGRRPNDLSQLYNTAKMFPPEVRDPDVPYNAYLLAMRMSRKFRHLELEPAAVLDQVLSHGFTQHRDVTRFFSQLARAADNQVGSGARKHAARLLRQSRLSCPLSVSATSILSPHDQDYKPRPTLRLHEKLRRQVSVSQRKQFGM